MLSKIEIISASGCIMAYATVKDGRKMARTMLRHYPGCYARITRA